MADKRIFFGSLEHSVDVEKLQAKDLAIRQAGNCYSLNLQFLMIESY